MKSLLLEDLRRASNFSGSRPLAEVIDSTGRRGESLGDEYDDLERPVGGGLRRVGL
jgi:hypothetical protein